MKRPVFYLLFLIPGASVVMGIVTLYFAFSAADPVVSRDAAPLDKSSWRERPVTPDDD